MKPITIDLDLPLNPYSIHIGNSWRGIADAVKPLIGHKVMLITDETVYDLFADEIISIFKCMGCKVSLAVIPPGEGSKSLKMAESLYTQALKAGLNRTSSILALGGGVVGDLAGFIAATYMRGIDFIQLPTTLLAQVDSSVGGKVAVNHFLAKNIIGSFYQPKSVYTNINTLNTLPDRQFSTGMAELIKYGFVWDITFLRWLTCNIDDLMSKEKDSLAYAIGRCCQTKSDIVAEDETEKGLRAILNFGHTIGHGLEAITSFNVYTHGEAVALGMVYESLIALHMDLIDQSLISLLVRLLKKANLPTEIDSVDIKALLESMARDKKNKGGSITFVLPTDMGKVEIFNDVDTSILYEIFK